MTDDRLMTIILAPHISEKSTVASGFNQYIFKVTKSATKEEIKKAIELLFSVKVDAVRVSNSKPKKVRFGRIEGKRKGWKKAIVKLAPEHTIDLTGAQA